MAKDYDDQTIGGVNLGGLTDYLFVFTDGSQDANWQGASKGFVGDVAVDGLQASERTSGTVPFAGTVYTNDTTAGAWAGIADQNATSASVSTGETALIDSLEADLESAFDQIDALAVTSGFESVDASELDGLNTQNGMAETFVINVTSGFGIDYTIDITGDADDVYILRWDEDADPSNGYQGTVKFQSGGGINPLGDLSPSNFIHVAGDIDASGGGSTPSGLIDDVGELEGVGGGGYFTGYWLTTGDPDNGDTQSLSNAIFTGGWYTSSDKFSLTSGTSGVYVAPTTAGDPIDPVDPTDPECITVLENTDPVIADLNCGTGTPTDIGLDACEVRDTKGYDKPSQLTILYNPDASGQNSQGSKANVEGSNDDDDTAYIVIRAKDSGGEIYFQGAVTKGDAITFGPGVGDTLESNTYMAVYEDEAAFDGGVGPLQEIDLHTSCSAPIVIGESVGSVVISGFGFDAGGTVDSYGGTDAPGDEGVVYYISGGDGFVEGMAGDPTDNSSTIFEVDPKTGEVSFITPPDFENPLDANGENKYGVQVTAYELNEDGSLGEVCEIKDLEVCVEDDCINVSENTTEPVFDFDCGEVENPDIGLAVCEIDKPTEYTFRLDTEIDNQLSAFQPDGKSSVTTTAAQEDGDGVVFVRMSDSDVATNTSGETYFEGELSLGDSFTTGGDGTFSSNSYIHIFDDDGTTLLQTIQFHTSCSAPIVIGDQIGTAILDAAVVQGITYGAVNLNPDEGLVYEITGGENAALFTVDEDTGEVSFINPPDFENPQGVNGTNTYQVEVTAFRVDDMGNKIVDANGEFVVCGVKPLDICVEDDGCINILADASATKDLDLEVDCGNDTGLDLCVARDQTEAETPAGATGADLTSKPVQLTLKVSDTLLTDIDFFYDDPALNQDGKPKVETAGSGDPVFVIVSKEGDSKKAIEKYLDPSKGVNGKETYFAGAAGYGDEIVANAATEFGSDTYVYFFTAEPINKEVAPLQAVKFHTSCSEPLVIGDRFGLIEMSGAAFRDKQTGELVSFKAGPGLVDEASGDLTYAVVDDGGESQFFNVDPDTGEVTFNAPAYVEGGDNAYKATIQAFYDADGDGVADDPDCVTEVEVCFDVNAAASLGDLVFLDANADGIQDGGEDGIEGVTVTLLADLDDDGDIDDVVATDVTDADGLYGFAGLTPGEEYQVRFDQPAGFEVSPADQGTDDTVDSDGLLSDVVVLTSGENDPTIDQGFYELASLGDRVFEDTNGDGVQGDAADEPGVEGVTVDLLDENGDVVRSETTDADGNYLFEDLEPGDYQVRFTAPDGFQFTDPNQGGDNALDSDADPTTGLTQTVTLTSGENNLTLDAGLVQTASLGDLVFLDANADGIQDGGENGIQGVTVTLLADLDDDGDIDDVVATDVTDADGLYGFAGLTPGEEYQVRFDQPAGFEVSPADQGTDDTVDSDGLLSDVVVLTSGENDPTIDQGFYELASLGDRVFEDTNGDGVQGDAADEPGVEGVTVDLLDENGDVVRSETTDADGNYLFEDLEPGDYQVRFTAPDGFQFTDPNQGGDNALDSDADPTTGLTQTVTLTSGENNLTLDAGLVQTASLGDLVFLDANADGIQDGGENGIQGVTVTLLADLDDDGDIDDVVATDVTDADGLYGFAGLTPGEEYQVRFDQPAGFEVSPADQGTDDTVDSDGLLSDVVVLTSGENDPTIDQGFYELASLGDRVFEDTNGDGVQGDAADEPGVEGVTVDLLDENGDVVRSETTDADGNYLFEDLEPGDYQVRFTAPDGFQFTDPNQGGDNALDSDADPTTGLTQTVTLTSGENNLTLDAGLVQTASLGDLVFLDANADGIQDGGEDGIEGVTVTLLADLDDDGDIDDVVATDVTDADGLYGFAGLTPGEEYQVRFDQPAGFEVSPADQGTDDTVDSDGLLSDVVVLTSGENDPTIDQGFYELASLGDRVFEDTNGDGVQGDAADEPGVEGVTVDLLDENGDVVRSETTDADGNYLFEDLEPGDYQVRFTAPDGFQFTDPNQGGDNALDSDADPTTGLTQTVTLTSGENNLTLDAGLVQTASLGDLVFLDANADGIQDGGENGIQGVTVTLLADLDDDGDIDDVVATDVTDADGLYGFAGLTPGEEYQVRFDQPAGFEVSPADQGTDDTVDSDGLLSDVVVLTSGENDPTIDQGFYELASLGDRVFEDTNGDGVQGDAADEPGVEGVTVDLLDENGDVVRSETTDADGNYLFEDLEPGDYQVRFTAPDGFQFTDPNQGGDNALDSDADPTTGLTQTVTLTSGENNLTLDAGLVQTASLGDLVFLDANADGIQDGGENGIQGVTVTLLADLDDDGDIDDVVATDVTDADGLYGFAGLTPGEEYQVRFDQPAGFEVSPADQGTDDTVDSDGLLSDVVVLTSGENDPTIDQGFYELASLGDRVFEDTNGDGVQGDAADEPGVEGVTVDLLDENGDVVRSETTDADGNYLFEDLEPGDYQVRFTAPDGFQFTDPNQGGDNALDSDADPTTGLTQTVTLTSGENNLTLDAGLVQTASLGDLVFLDANADGIQDGGENGIQGVTVTLLADLDDDGDIDDVVATDVTDADGLYGFAGLTPGEEYQVRFDQPAGFEVSPADQGTDDTVDSDGLLSDVVVLTSGENDPTIDQGFYELASLGDRVFEDTNGDGVQGDAADEPGVEGVTVDLLDENGDVVRSETTDADGNYLFEDLEPGDYQVRFTAPDGFQFTDPNQGGDNALDSDADPTTGLTQTVTLTSGENNLTLDAGLVQTASLGDLVFLDANADGIQDGGENGIQGVTVTLLADLDDDGDIDDVVATDVTDADGLYGFAGLTPGEEYQVRFDQPAGFEVSPADQGTDDTVDSDGLLSDVVVLTSGENDPTIDQGFYELASLGDRVFEDTNGDGVQGDAADEPGVEGVTVDLLDENGDVVRSETTDADGNYLFEDLEPGDYQVRFTAPDGFQFTDPNQGGDNALDSDADPTTGLTQTVTLTSGENNLTLDAGLVQTASLGDLVFLDANADGIQDGGENGIQGVTVTLLADLDDDGDIDDVVATDVTDADGLYGFAGLTPGEEYQVRFDQPAGFEVSPADQGTDDTVDSDGLLSDVVVLTSGENDPTIDQGFYELASLGDRVFEDTNGDGVQGDAADEPGVEGVTVDLLDENGDVVRSETTDADGNYLFEDLEPGDYQVRFTAPDGFQFTDPNQGGDNALDSDADPTTGLTQTVTLTSGENNLTLDAGIVGQLGSISGRYFCDDNDSNVDDGEDGVANRTVTLDGAGNDGAFGTADDILLTTTTAGDGSYSFTGLEAGDYKITVKGAGFVVQDFGLDDTIDSDVNAMGMTDVFVLGVGEHMTDVDAGTKCLNLQEVEIGNITIEGLLAEAENSAQFGFPRPDENVGRDSYFYDADSDMLTGTIKLDWLKLAGQDLIDYLYDDAPSLQFDINLDENGDIVSSDALDIAIFEDGNDNGLYDDGETLLLSAEAKASIVRVQEGDSQGTFEFVFEVTGGDLADEFDPLLGMSVDNFPFVEPTTFPGFDEDFEARPKGFVGDIGFDCFCLPEDTIMV